MPTLQQMNVMKIEQNKNITLQNGIFRFHFSHKLLPSVFTCFFKCVKDVHDHFTMGLVIVLGQTTIESSRSSIWVQLSGTNVTCNLPTVTFFRRSLRK